MISGFEILVSPGKRRRRLINSRGRSTTLLISFRMRPRRPLTSHRSGWSTRAIAPWDIEKPLLGLAEEDLDEEVVVPPGLLPLAGNANLLLGRRPLEQRQGDPPDQPEVLRPVVLPHPAGILLEGHVEDPV